MAWVNLNTIYATKSEVNSKVPNTRTINGKALSSNVTLGASDIKLSDDTTLQSAWDSISKVEYFASESNTFNVTPKISGIVEVECVVHSTFGAWANNLSARIATPDGLTLIAGTASAINGNDQVLRSFRARAVFSGVKSGSAYNFSVYRTDGSFGNSPSFSWFITVRQY